MFLSARIQLTFWYLLIIMIISIAFSSVIYRFLALEVDRFAQLQQTRMIVRTRTDSQGRAVQLKPGELPDDVPPIDQELIAEVKKRLYFAIAVINGGIFVVAGGLAYFVAGKTLQPIQDMVDEQHRFISDASHELKTPLTSLKTSFEVYLRSTKKTKQEGVQLIEESIDEVNKLQQLTESMLQLANPYNNKKIQLSSISLSPLIEESVKQLRPLAQSKKIKIKYQKKDEKVKGDRESLKKLIVILIDNAIKYSHQKTQIIVTEQKVKNEIVLKITNTGIGILPKDMPLIFDRFYRADQARSKTHDSSYGLGLSIAQKIVEEHQGSISAKSNPDKETTFTVKLPIA